MSISGRAWGEKIIGCTWNYLTKSHMSTVLKIHGMGNVISFLFSLKVMATRHDISDGCAFYMSLIIYLICT